MANGVGAVPPLTTSAPLSLSSRVSNLISSNRSKPVPSTRPSGPAPPIPLSSRRSDPLDLKTVERKGDKHARRDEIPRQHIHGIPEAPTFRPTTEEWGANPIEYIRKIEPEGSKFGIVKIIPPDSWNPEFMIDSERFHFRTRKQELNSVEGGTRANLNYLDQLAKFHRSQGLNLNRFPSVDKRPLDLYELKKAVDKRGGFDQVCKGKKWAEIGRDLGYSGKIMSSLSTSLKNSYGKWLEPYEAYLRVQKGAVLMEAEQKRGGPYATPSPAASPADISKSGQHTPSQISRHAPAMNASQALQESIQQQQTNTGPEVEPRQRESPRPPSGFTPVNSNSFKAANTGLASTSFAAINTPQGFLLPDKKSFGASDASKSFSPSSSFSSSSQTANGNGAVELKRQLSDAGEDGADHSVDANGRRSKRLKRETPHTVTGSHMMQPKNSGTRPPAPSRDRKSDKPGDFCELCGKDDDEQSLLICDGCYQGYHCRCLNPPLLEVPDNDWHCPRCLVGTGEFGFEEGGVYSLKQFQEKAKKFKDHHFSTKRRFDPILDGPRPITEDDIEREFWRLVSSLTETVEVEYGADIHSTTHGSAFPTIERNPRNEYSLDSWNLNNLPLHPDSLFRHIKSDISGMTVPWLYVGMCFSTFCWHNEDHYAYSANYQHFGATKTWYGIPGQDTEKFEEAMRQAVPDLFEQQPDLLFQLVTLLPPDQLRKAGVNVYAVDQRAGQIVITFPQAYHAGFNHGFNFNEAVNFAPSDWEPFGQAGVDRLREFRRHPCFSHDELLLATAASKDMSIKTARWLAPALQRMFEREKSNRHRFEDQLEEKSLYRPDAQNEFRFQLEHVVEHDDLPEDDYECDYCKAFSYLSRFTCEATGKKSCLEHIIQIHCCRTVEGHQTHYRMTTSKLEQVVSKISERARVPEAWREKFDAAIAETARPQLKALQSLLSEGEKIPWQLPELGTLRVFVDRCNEWVEEATNYITRKQQNRRKNEKLWRRGSQAKNNDSDDREKESKKLDNIRKLLSAADEIGFDCPQIATLQERANMIAEFQKDARAALTSLAHQTTQQIEDLIEMGKGFGVEIPELDRLDKIVQQMRWMDKAKDRAQQQTLQDVTDLIEVAAELDVPEHNEHLILMTDQKRKGEIWEAKAKELMAVENIHFQQLDDFSKQAAHLPVSKETLAAIDVILRKQREAQEKIGSLYDRSNAPSIRQRPKYEEVRELQDNIGELNSKPNGITDLERQQKKHEDWMRRGKKLFGKTNAPLNILLQHMSIVDQKNRKCFSISDQLRLPVEPRSRENTPDVSNHSSGKDGDTSIFCLCRSQEQGTMIECGICHEWYHNKCLKLARGKYKDDDFTCPICDWRVKIPRDAARPKVEELMAWQSEIPDLPFQPDEEECLDSIIDTALAFRAELDKYMQQPSIVSTYEEVPIQRFYLRKLEGADILLANETNLFRQELHRFVPIAPEPPPIIQFSNSTRKPRPTKQQKLMKEMGVDNPEDLPPEARTKPWGKTKTKFPDLTRDPSDGRKSGGDGLSPQQGSATTAHYSGRSGSSGHPKINFKPPLTASEFPRRQNHPNQHTYKNSASQQSPRAESPVLTASLPNSATPAQTALPGLGSPFGGSFQPSPSEQSRESMIDPSLFNSRMSVGSFGDEHVRSPSAPHQTPGDFSGQAESDLFDKSPDSAGRNSATGHTNTFGELFADITNEDQDEAGSVHSGGDPNLDRASGTTSIPASKDLAEDSEVATPH